MVCNFLVIIIISFLLKFDFSWLVFKSFRNVAQCTIHWMAILYIFGHGIDVSSGMAQLPFVYRVDINSVANFYTNVYRVNSLSEYILTDCMQTHQNLLHYGKVSEETNETKDTIVHNTHHPNWTFHRKTMLYYKQLHIRQRNHM